MKDKDVSKILKVIDIAKHITRTKLHNKFKGYNTYYFNKLLEKLNKQNKLRLVIIKQRYYVFSKNNKEINNEYENIVIQEDNIHKDIESLNRKLKKLAVVKKKVYDKSKALSAQFAIKKVLYNTSCNPGELHSNIQGFSHLEITNAINKMVENGDLIKTKISFHVYYKLKGV